MKLVAAIVFCLLLTAVSSFCDSTSCVPPCRPDCVCKNGECVSKCNPPCPADLICGGDLGCITKDQYGNLTDSHYTKICLTSLMTAGGILLTVVGIVAAVRHTKTDETNLLMCQVGGPCLVAVSIPLNLLTWSKFLKAKRFREKNNLPPR